MNRKPKYISIFFSWTFLICSGVTSINTHAQDTLNCMFYNVLNYPDPNPAGKADTLANILSHHPVDLLMMCELKTEAGADTLLANAFNINGEDKYRRATFVPQTSNPASSYKLQQLIIYNNQKLGLADEQIIITPVRDVNMYSLYLREADLATTGDTTFLDVYVTHLKSSQGGTNENLREQMVDSLLNFLATRPTDHHVIFAGDFNVYSSSEAAYQKIIAPLNPIPLKDPINTPGNWNNNSSFADVHTQSTRSSQLYGDGAGGGMDDRFDFMMLSESLMLGTGDLAYVNNSYKAFGNAGDCFNQSITQCNTTVYPYDLLRSLYYMSDHLPVTLELATPLLNGVVSKKPKTTLAILGNPADETLRFQFSNPNQKAFRAEIIDLAGKVVLHQQFTAKASQISTIRIASLHSGYYFLSIKTEDGTSATLSFIHP